jgi:capsular polysaccharide biosynthesis protein
MEKLSSILPASPRVKSVDLSEAKPRRPGSPNFGVPEGSTSSVRDRVSVSSRIPSESIKENVTYKNPRDLKSAKLANEVTKNFFENRLNLIGKDSTMSEPVVDGLDEKFQESSAAELERAYKNSSGNESKVSPDALD